MDGNKDEASKCLRIAETAIDSGDGARALKFIAKARRLDPSLSVDDLLAKIEPPTDDSSRTRPNSGSPSSPVKPTDDNKENTGPRRRAISSGSSSSVAYTEEQTGIVMEVKRKKDYYEILGLEKTCSLEDVRKAYRKLSLKVHPDKNKAPGAEEAFKAVSKAFQCLSNEESRKKYDLVGSDEQIYERRPARRGGQPYNGFYDGDIDADEIFRNFFFGGMHPATTTQFGAFSFGPGMGARMSDQGAAGFNLRSLIQLLPVMLILLLNFLPSPEPIYSLSRDYPYEYRITTQKGVNFYVKSSKFEQEYPSNGLDRVALEQKVERDYFSILAHNCRLEMQRFHWGRAKDTPHCDTLKRFERMA